MYHNAGLFTVSIAFLVLTESMAAGQVAVKNGVRILKVPVPDWSFMPPVTMATGTR